MGCCLGRSSASDSDDLDNAITIGKNRPLIQERFKWKSDVPMTEGQLRSKRDEFWETAPAFEGRKEIWDALRAATGHAEQGDYALSQAILDGANITLPDGTLRESYDELGNRYQVPYYCLSAPTNLVEEHSSSESSAAGGMNSDIQISNSDRTAGGVSSASGGGELQSLKLRLSTTGEDIKIECRSKETVYMVKQRLHQTLKTAPPSNQQRWFYGGRILLDKMKIVDCHIPQNFVVQVVQHNNTNNNAHHHHQRLDVVETAIFTPPPETPTPTNTRSNEQSQTSRKSSSSSRKSHNKNRHHHQRAKQLRSQPLQQSQNQQAQQQQHSGEENGQNSSLNVRNGTANSAQRRCNSLNSKRSLESPTPVETC